MKIAVAGGTGLIGRRVVEALQAAGVDTVVLSRRDGVDVATGEGLEAALAGVSRVIDVTNPGNPEEAAATSFFTAVASRLQAAGERAGVERLVVLSIVGIDVLTSGYWAAKRAHERAARSGPVPAVVVRSTQFHEFAGQVLTWPQQDGAHRLPATRMQPVAAEAAARAVADLAIADGIEAGQPEIAGPRVEELLDMATRLAARRGDAVPVEEYRDGSPDGQAVATGALLPGPSAVVAGPTFQEWLDAGEQAPL